MHFVTYGPFELPRWNTLIDDDSEARDFFWSQSVEATAPGLADAIGCYVFSIRTGGGSLPWYVGKTEIGFRNECFQAHKLKYYNKALAARVGSPVLFLIPKITPANHRFAHRSTGNSDIEFLENYLIGRALVRNDGLMNKQNTRLLREIKFQGFMNSDPGHPGSAAIELREILD